MKNKPGSIKIYGQHIGFQQEIVEKKGDRKEGQGFRRRGMGSALYHKRRAVAQGESAR